MHFLYALFIALANNVDNISVRIAYSIRGIKITAIKNLWISLITFLISSIAAISGNLISGIFSKQLSSLLSMVLLASIGLWIMLEPYFKKNNTETDEIHKDGNKNIYIILKRPEKADIDNSKDIDFKEATMLGIALSINNIGGGISAGMIGLNSFFIGFFSALISFIALWIGNYVTDFLNRWNFNRKATVIAGLILILIGLKQII
ncbi:sporulation membrane protein YtaF [Thermoanaerobacterium sp. CMT5567-10]|uniref:sporulation membrane protein YtaF n=1 Tax=Thermoanaerobacterium sp. CMT5567-10 TaxID=3061989 RepID=UPI0026DFD07D|nr:sporulation membrane protein YtaF [Thermoanaerobacterium sp. CMT5567-10]WKV07549.1 sporulation membrane protein YtaF [Thermoanaerobacterium sp. CMT5567-10]